MWCRGKVVLLSGWLLMVPPLEKGDGRPDGQVVRKAPIPEWSQVGAYDTAEACERARAENIGHRVRQTKDTYPQNFMNTGAFDAAAGARCVPPDAVYPPARPPASSN